jgi:hypothetical protein
MPCFPLRRLNFKTARRCPAGPQKSESIANHATIQSGRIGVKKAAAQKESRAESQPPGFNMW